MQLLGTVVRLQVQRSRLKPGPRGQRVYDPSPLAQVERLEVGPRGVIGRTAQGPPLLDVHHADHPDSRNVALRNGISLLPLAHYDTLRARYGAHLSHGAAGESVLLDTEGPLGAEDVTGVLELETVDGPPLVLHEAVPAPPCVEFSRFCLRQGLGPVDDEVRQALLDLDGGARGFYARTDDVGTVAVGARLWRRERGADHPTGSCPARLPGQADAPG